MINGIRTVKGTFIGKVRMEKDDLRAFLPHLKDIRDLTPEDVDTFFHKWCGRPDPNTSFTFWEVIGTPGLEGLEPIFPDAPLVPIYAATVRLKVYAWDASTFDELEQECRDIAEEIMDCEDCWFDFAWE